MALTPRLEIRQGQTLVMTPQLQQAIKLLQLSNIELSNYVEEELERNPLLERADSQNDSPSSPEAERKPQETSPANQEDPPAPVTSDRTLKDENSAFERAETFDTGINNLYDSDTGSDTTGMNGSNTEAFQVSNWTGVSTSGGSFSDSEFSLEATLSNEISMRDHLEEQLSVATSNLTHRLIGTHMIDLLDESGYLRIGTEDIAERLGASLEDVEETLRLVQTFDPTGIFARDLKECLSLQLVELDRYDPAMQTLIENIELFAKRDYAKLIQLCGIDGEDLQDMFAEIRRLQPKPGATFGSLVVQPMIPDVYVRETSHGGWAIELNTETLPRVLINQRYYAEVNSDGLSKADKGYISECMQNANWLVKSLEQRARTILKVATEIVRQQDGFFAFGIAHLAPLNLKSIAEAIEMHESTVSRVTSNKYLACNRGVFEMKYFFNSAIASSDGGDSFAAESVRHRIRGLINNETPSSVLSDDRIVDRLRDDGIDIARRTVAKYRESMHIPSSVQRRREKNVHM